MAGMRVRTSLAAYSNDQFSGGIAAIPGTQVVMDFYTWCYHIGAAFQVRAGTISTPIVGDVLITDTAAEMATAAGAGLTIIPVSANISFRLAAGTLFESAGKSVNASTMSAGTAFIALPVKLVGPQQGATPTAASSSSMVGTAGGVTVAAEAVTTTRRHFSWGNPIAAGAWPTIYDWNPRVPPPISGAACFYVQIAGTGTGPSYYASYEFIEQPTANLFG